MTADQAGGENVLAFLNVIGQAEGTSTSRYTKDDGYDIIVDGLNSPHTFSDYSKHPGVLVTVNRAGLQSTAAGRYQVLKRYWTIYRDLLRLPDFGPVSQDRIAIRLISEQHALDDVKKGRLTSAITKCANIWASFPMAGYSQHEQTLDFMRAAYIKFGGECHD